MLLAESGRATGLSSGDRLCRHPVTPVLCLQNPVERLGCHPETGFADIQSHPFFRSIEWDLLYNKQISPPYKPRVQSEMDLEHFDPQFTNEPVLLTPDDA